jgi:hypothetical protein
MERFEDFTDAKDGLAEISRKIVTARKRWMAARRALGVARDELAALNEAYPTGFRELLQLVNQAAAARPDDPAWQDLKVERDKIVADGSGTLAAMNAALAAFDNA